MLRSLIQQLSDRNENIQGLLEDFYSSHNNGNREPLMGELCRLFKEMIRMITRVHIIIDAPDECTTREDTGSTIGILSWIEDIATKCPNASLMFTSQLLDEIPSTIRTWADQEDEVSIQSGSATDIETYIQTRIRNSAEFKRWQGLQNAHILEDIEKTLMQEADGM